MTTAPGRAGGRQRPTALLVDLDGVLRRWDPAVAAKVEADHGLPAGALIGTAMDWSRLRPAIAGEVSDADWMAGVVEALAEQAGGRERAEAAVAEWRAYRGEADPDVLAFVRQVRAAGLRVGLATNDRVVRGARATGLFAYRWNGVGDLPYLRAALAV